MLLMRMEIPFISIDFLNSDEWGFPEYIARFTYQNALEFINKNKVYEQIC